MRKGHQRLVDGAASCAPPPHALPGRLPGHSGPGGADAKAAAEMSITQAVGLLARQNSRPRDGTSVAEFNQVFPDDAACKRFLYELRLDRLRSCPACGRPTSWSIDRGRDAYICSRCRYRINLRAGTLFARSPRSLRDLFYAVLLCANTNATPPVKVLARHLGLSPKGAWGFAGKLRAHLSDHELARRIGGAGRRVSVAVVRFKRLFDLTASGKATNPVLVLSDRFHCVAAVLPNTRPASLFKVVRQRVLPGSLLYSDDSMLMRKLGIYRQRWFAVAPLDGQFEECERCRRNGEIWTLMAKKAITHTYVRVSTQKLDLYLGEQLFRFNHRGGSVFWPMLGCLPEHPRAPARAAKLPMRPGQES